MEETKESMIRIKFLDETPEFVGTDVKSYGPFNTNEVSEIPVDNAKLLIDSGKAEVNDKKEYVYGKVSSIIQNKKPKDYEELEELCSKETIGITRGELKNRIKGLKEDGVISYKEGCLSFNEKVEREKECLDFLNKPTLLNDIKKEIDFFVTGEDQTKITFFLLCLSKDFNPQSIVLVSESSAGKSYMSNSVLDFFPDDVVERFTRSSARGLEYKYEGMSLDGKILLIQEALGGEESQGSLRPLISKDQKGLKIITVGADRRPHVIEVKGSPVFITTTANPQRDIEKQMVNRVWILSIDESLEQTARIIDYQSEKYSSLDEIMSEKKELIKDSISLLSSKGVKRIRIPFAKQLKQYFPVDKVKYRRDYEKLLILISCSSFLHQFQRKIVGTNHGNTIIAADIDLINALECSSKSLEQTLLGISDIAGRILKTIIDMDNSAGHPITVESIAQRMNFAEGSIYRFKKELVDGGYIITDRTKKPYTFSPVKFENPAEKLLEILTKTGDDFFSKKDYEEWLSHVSYSLTDGSVEYFDIIQSRTVDGKIVRQEEKEENVLQNLTKTEETLVSQSKIEEDVSDDTLIPSETREKLIECRKKLDDLYSIYENRSIPLVELKQFPEEVILQWKNDGAIAVFENTFMIMRGD